MTHGTDVSARFGVKADCAVTHNAVVVGVLISLISIEGVMVSAD